MQLLSILYLTFTINLGMNSAWGYSGPFQMTRREALVKSTLISGVLVPHFFDVDAEEDEARHVKKVPMNSQNEGTGSGSTDVEEEDLILFSRRGHAWLERRLQRELIAKSRADAVNRIDEMTLAQFAERDRN